MPEARTAREVPGRPAAGPRIVFFNRFFGTQPELHGAEAHADFQHGPAVAADADCVVFHLPTLDLSALPGKPAGQMWVAWSLESPVTCPAMGDPALLARFDATMTYERTSDLWFPYFGPGTAAALAAPPSHEREVAPVCHLQSNPYDACDRNRYAFELMRRIRVDSYGDVLRTRRERIPPGWAERVAVMRRYKFTLAFENSFATDYVSDKFFDALVAGSVPVYRGAPEVAELAPAADCFVDVRDFAGPAELARFLDHLDHDDDAYASYQAWRGRGLSSAFRAHLERLAEPPFTRLARRVAAWIADGRPSLAPARPSAAGSTAVRTSARHAPALRPDSFDAAIWSSVATDYLDVPAHFAPGEVVLDVGCHTGAFAALAAARGARVVAYEAAAENCELARRNTARWPAVEIRHGAIWRSDVAPGRLRLVPSTDPKNTGGGSVLVADDLVTVGNGARAEPPAGWVMPQEVPAIALDEVLRELGAVRLLKLDVEGAEVPILATARELGRVAEVVGELHELSAEDWGRLPESSRVAGFPADRRGLAAALAAAGFDLASLRPGGAPHLLLFTARRTAAGRGGAAPRAQ
jgi:FkbM family methyltransferase